MSMDIKRVSEYDPNRCQYIGAKGQCWCKAMEGSKYCKSHGGSIGAAHYRNKNVRNFQLQFLNIDRYVNSPSLKNLHEEVGILRLNLETLLNRCRDDNTLIRHSTQIMMLVDKIERLVTSAHKLDISLNGVFDRAQLTAFVDGIITIIEDKVPEADTRTEIAQAIGGLLEGLKDDVNK